MATESIRSRCMPLDAPAEQSMRLLLEALYAELLDLRTKHGALLTKLDVLTAKLNADAGVTDTNYATDFAAGATTALAAQQFTL